MSSHSAGPKKQEGHIANYTALMSMRNNFMLSPIQSRSQATVAASKNEATKECTHIFFDLGNLQNLPCAPFETS